MEIELSFYPDIELIIKDGRDNSSTQIKQIKELIDQEIDLLIVSPNESEPIAPIVEQVYNSGIPVIVIDRKVKTDKYTAFIGGDNYIIGVEAGNHAARLLQNGGKILEIRGLEGSSPSQERHNGFARVLNNFPDITIVKSVSGDWKTNSANKIINEAINDELEFDLVFAHNDVMAREVRKVTQQYRETRHTYVLGVDGLPGTEGGIQMVLDNVLDATFMYKTGGGLAIQIANDILNKRKVSKQNIIPTLTIDKNNAPMLKAQTDQIELLHNKIERQKLLLTIETNRNKTKNLILFFLIAVLTLTTALIFMIYLNLNDKKKLNKILVDKNEEIEKQNQLLKEQHERLKKIDKELEEATQAKLTFFTNISHEFKTPLTLIKGPLESLIEEKMPPSDIKKNYQIMHRNTHRLLQMINQLLDFRMIENKKMRIKASENNLDDFLNDICASFQTLADKKDISLTYESTIKYPVIWFDYEKIEKVMFNLLSNAFKFTPQKGRIKIILRKHKINNPGLFAEEFCIEVKDSGEGIPKEDLPKIFERYYQKDESRIVKGSGIGLNFSRELVELHRGRIKVESTEGEGTSVFVWLPVGNLHLVEDEMIKNRNIETSPNEDYPFLDEPQTAEAIDSLIPDKEATFSILITEDMPDMLDYLRMMLKDRYKIYTATNGKEGIEQVLEEEPDLIISDIMMPKMDGFEMTRQLKSDTKTSHIPIILLTAKTSIKNKIEGMEDGADYFIEKPFSKALLLSTINNLLVSRKKLREHYRETLSFKETENGINQLDQQFLKKLRHIILENIGHDDINVDELASKLGLSRVHLYRKVKKITDMSVSEFVISIKLKKSLDYLRNSGKTITEIAYESGFSSQSYYTRCFKEQFKMSPSKYKKQYRST
ncbi:substrate-binding domain-containing protein [Draconibacterium halophilum]|uniref:histidine kinase n=2 Tax=Draconibacterium halophilum TaxID=2706887 RepID=A0A6C0RDW1_9BACT|nr:substrate-binding domain-containing protein [Draconibacterium halophilum]QIA07693.1 substrate-binding domain-containing protein [Draconibacterium halophilum]